MKLYYTLKNKNKNRKRVFLFPLLWPVWFYILFYFVETHEINIRKENAVVYLLFITKKEIK
jgi:hypothetical protein